MKRSEAQLIRAINRLATAIEKFNNAQDESEHREPLTNDEERSSNEDALVPMSSAKGKITKRRA